MSLHDMPIGFVKENEMTVISKYRSGLESLSGTLRYGDADVLASLGSKDADQRKSDSSLRKERLVRIRSEIADGTYHISSSRLSRSLMETMLGRSESRFPGNGGTSRDRKAFDVVSYNR
jgi:anti-sigma28 factor (negative regulator of flagellin synthesis)